MTSIGDRAFSDCDSLTSITLPEGLTSIGERAFFDCYNLTSITIPSSVTSIGDRAFEGCTKLTSITVDESNANYCSEDGVLFDKAKAALIQYPRAKAGAEYIIPSGVTSIGAYAFYYCDSLKSVEIPTGVTSIGAYAFYECYNLTSITLPEGLTSIGDRAFYECSSLLSIVIPESVTSIGEYVFECWDDDYIYEAVYVTIIGKPGSYAETYAKSNGIDFLAIAGGKCGDNLTWNMDAEGKLTISGSGKMYDYSASNPAPWHSSASGAKEVLIGDDVESIGSFAFKNFEIEKITIPSGITEIGASAFSDCKNLESLFIPDGVISIGNSAFFGCKNLVIYGNSGSAIESYAKENVLNFIAILGSGSYGENIKWTFYDTGLLVISGSGEMPAENSYSDLPWSDFCNDIKNIVIESGVKSISGYAFYNCINLTNITILGSVASIGESSFFGCNSLASVTINSGVKSIGASAFGNCSALARIIIPSSVTAIGKNAFSGCPLLKIYAYSSSYAKTYANNNSMTFVGLRDMGSCGANLTWYYTVYNELIISGTGEMDYYSDEFDTPWYEYSDEYETGIRTITIDQGVTSITSEAFSGCWYLESVSVPSSVTNIERYTFSNFRYLENIMFSEGLTSIGYNAFSWCSSLKDITLPQGVTSIGSDAFRYCSSLTSITIPPSVTSIGDSAFYGCSKVVLQVTKGSYAETYAKNNSLAYVATEPSGTCGDNLTWAVDGDGTLTISGTGEMKNYSESYGAPWRSLSIKDVVVESGVLTIGSYAFYNCKSLTSIEIPASVTSIADNAFESCSGIMMYSMNNSNAAAYAEAHDEIATCISVDEEGNTIGETYEYVMTFDILNSENMCVSSSNYMDTDVLRNAHGASLFNREKMGYNATFSIDKNGNKCEPYDVFKKDMTADWEFASGYSNGIYIGKQQNALCIHFRTSSYGNTNSGHYAMLRLNIPKAGKYTLSFDGNRYFGEAATAIYFAKDDGSALNGNNRDYAKFTSNLVGYANFSDTTKTGYVNVGTVTVTTPGDYYLGIFPNKESLIKSPTSETAQKVELRGIKLSPYQAGDDANDIESVELVPQYVRMAVGETSTTTTRVNYSRTGLEILTEGVTYSSDNPAVASVSANGVVTAKSDGTANITASIDGTDASGSVEITVFTDNGNGGVVCEYVTTWNALQADKLPMTTDSTLYSSGTYTRNTDSGIIMNRALMNRNATAKINSAGEEVPEWRLMDFSVTAPWDMACEYSQGGVRIFKKTNNMYTNFQKASYGTSSSTILVLRLSVPNKGTYNLSIDSSNVAAGAVPAIYFVHDDKTVTTATEAYTKIISKQSPVGYHNFSDTTQSGYKRVAQVEAPRGGEYLLIFYGDSNALSYNTTTFTSGGKEYQEMYLNKIKLEAIPHEFGAIKLSTDGIDAETGYLKCNSTARIAYSLTDAYGIMLDEIDSSKLSVSYSSANDNATVSADGVITANKIGDAEITVTATYDGITISDKISFKVVPAGEITNLSIASDKELIAVNEKVKITATATYTESGVCDVTSMASFESDNESVARVDGGVITAVSAGSANITASIDGKSATVLITVYKPLENLSLDKTAVTVERGNSATLAPIFAPSDATYKNVSWSSSDETVATVEGGVVTAKKSGKTTITATSEVGGFTATCEVTVITPVKGIALDKSSVTIEKGETTALTATLTPSDADNTAITWSSSNASVATVEDGIITAHNAGTATITAKSADGGYTATCDVKVIISVTGVTLSETDMKLFRGQSGKIVATIVPNDATNKTISWSSSDETVATVEGGVVTAISAGKTTITATADGGRTATCEVSVIIPANGLVIDKANEKLTKGESTVLTATVYPSTTTETNVVWSSSNEDVATVDGGVVSAVGAGTAKITASTEDGEYSATCLITVTVPTSGIALDKSELRLTKGEMAMLEATVFPEDSTERKIIWKSSDVRVAIVDSGEVRAVNKGEAIITASTEDGSSIAECRVYVSATSSGTGGGEEPEQPSEIAATFSLGSAEARAGEIISIPLTLESEEELNSIAISALEFDETALEFIGFADYEHLDEKTVMPIEKFVDNEKGIILVPLAQSEKFNGVICSLRFRIKEISSGGEFTIGAKSLVKNDSDVIVSVVEPGSIAVTAETLGDITGDNNVDIKDAVRLFQYSMLPETYPIEYSGSLDFTKDGSIDIKDAVRLFQYSMLPEIYPIEE